MSFILNPYIFKKKDTIPSFLGYGITRFFGLVKPDIATIDYAVKILDNYNSRTLYVFFNDKNEIDTNSFVSTTTSPTLETLADVIADNVNIPISSLFCLVSGYEVSESFLSGAGTVAGYLVSGGSITKRNNKPVIVFPDGLAGYIAPPISDFNSDHSIVASTVPRTAGFSNTNTFKFILSTNPTTFTGKSIRVITTGLSCVVWRSTTTTYTLNSLSENSVGVRVNLYHTIDIGNEHILYKNAVFQNSASISGTTGGNINLIIGRGFPQPNGFTGELQILAISSNILSPAQITEIDGKINSIFG